MNEEKQNQECCPEFNPTPWDNKEFEWNNKKFIKGKVFTLFYMPINFGNVITKLFKKVEESGAIVPENICLSDHTSMWNMDIYMAVDKDIPNTENTAISGKFFSKVYEGDFKDTGKWYKDLESYLKNLNKEIKKCICGIQLVLNVQRNMGKIML